jgi:hypothetical protein
VLAATNDGSVVADGVLLAPAGMASPAFTLNTSAATPDPATTTPALAPIAAADGSQAAAAVDASLVALQDQAAASQDALITGVAQDRATKRKP